jgi:hypothetical protein
MRQNHLYLRAYMAGITVPTLFLLVVVTGFTMLHGVAAPWDRIIMFPMAVVPNLWGVWNILYCRRRWAPIGVHGAILPLLLVAAGFGLARALEVPWMSVTGAAIALPVVVVVYYLAWKYLVGFFNEVLGVA